MDAMHPPGSSSHTLSTADLRARCAQFPPPQVLDVRRPAAFERDPTMIPGAVRCPPDDVAAVADTLEPWRPVVTVCVHGHEVSQGAATLLRARGYDARALDGGHEQWLAEGGEAVPWRAPSHWVTRERPKIDRIACPWLVRRFVDPDAEFLYVPTSEVKKTAQEKEATAYDVADVEFSHDGDLCSFDAFLRKFHLNDPALDELALIVRGADTNRLDLAPQAPGLAAISLGLSRIYEKDLEMLEQGMVMYDALYAWCKEGKSEIHTWNPSTCK